MTTSRRFRPTSSRQRRFKAWLVTFTDGDTYTLEAANARLACSAAASRTGKQAASVRLAPWGAPLT